MVRPAGGAPRRVGTAPKPFEATGSVLLSSHVEGGLYDRTGHQPGQPLQRPERSANQLGPHSRCPRAGRALWLTTVRPDGRPHTTPVVAVWVDDALYFTTGAEEQKAKNLRACPHVVATTGCNGWESGLDVVVEGDALLCTDPAVLARIAEAFQTKWDGRWKFEARGERFLHPESFEVQLFTVAPNKVLAFAKGLFAHTTHRFTQA